MEPYNNEKILLAFTKEYAEKCNLMNLKELNFYEKGDVESLALSSIGRILINSLKDKYSILEIGCGTGGHFRYYTRARQITGIDISEMMLRYAPKDLNPKINLIEGTFLSTRFNEKYDFIWNDVWGHYEPLNSEVLIRCCNLLKSGGVLILHEKQPTNWRESLTSISNNFKMDLGLMNRPRKISKFFKRNALKVLFKLNDNERSLYFLAKE